MALCCFQKKTSKRRIHNALIGTIIRGKIQSRHKIKTNKQTNKQTKTNKGKQQTNK